MKNLLKTVLFNDKQIPFCMRCPSAKRELYQFGKNKSKSRSLTSLLTLKNLVDKDGSFTADLRDD